MEVIDTINAGINGFVDTENVGFAPKSNLHVTRNQGICTDQNSILISNYKLAITETINIYQ
jgi:hypothetical protein